MKIVDINQEQYNRLQKDTLYRQIEQVAEDVEQVEAWLKYRGTPNATVYRYKSRPGRIVWRVKV